MNDADLQEAANALADAEARRVPIAPLTESYPDLDLADAYAIQLRNVARRTRGDERLRGHKVGCTAVAMQELFGVDQPDYGHLFESMFVDDGGILALDGFISPQVEVEPAFLLERDLAGPGLTTADVTAATAAVVPALEIIDSRIADWRIKLEDTVADNGSSAAIVLGDASIPFDPDALADAHVELAMGGAVVEVGSTREILGHPAIAVAWLANELARFEVTLRAGQVVLPGTCTRSAALVRGVVTGAIDGIGSVSVTVV